MTRNQNHLDEEFEKHRPKLVFPIFNTFLGLLFIGFLIYLTIIQDLKIIVLIVAIILVLLFIVASWYNSYFSKKKTRKEIYNLQEETEMLINAIKEQKRKTIYEIINNKELIFKVQKNDNLVLNKTTYNVKNRNFEPTIENMALVNMCVTCAGLAINPKNGKVEGITGMAPCSVWIQRKLRIPQATKGTITLEAPKYQLSNKVIFKYLKHEDTFYDKKTGWLCLGPKKVESIDEAIEVAENVYVVLRDTELVSVWVLTEPNLPIA